MNRDLGDIFYLRPALSFAVSTNRHQLVALATKDHENMRRHELLKYTNEQLLPLIASLMKLLDEVGEVADRSKEFEDRIQAAKRALEGDF